MSEQQETPGIRRERSARYPSVPLAEAVAFCRQIDELGIDGLSAPQIATAMGYRNVKTNTFSGRLSSARQFGLIVLNDQNYSITELALRILHPIDPDEVPQLLRQACLSPTLYSDLLRAYSGKRLPEPEILANLLMHRHHITSSAKMAAAESFFDSIRHAGIIDEHRSVDASALGAESLIGSSDARHGTSVGKSNESQSPRASAGSKSVPHPGGFQEEIQAPRTNEVRLDLALWDADDGKKIRLRAPASMTRASLDRFLEALRLAVRITDESAGGAGVEIPTEPS